MLIISNGKAKKKIYKENIIKIQGHKHSLPLILSAALIFKKEVSITNLPLIIDTKILCEIIKFMGGNLTLSLKHHRIKLSKCDFNSCEIPQQMNELIHGSLYLIPAVIFLKGKVLIGSSGGCQIGEVKTLQKRPIEYIGKIVQKLGGTVNEYKGMIEYKLKVESPFDIDILSFSFSDKYLTGNEVSGATKMAILFALQIKNGKCIIRHPYLKTDVLNLLSFIQKNGYKVFFDNKILYIKKDNLVDVIKNEKFSELWSISKDMIKVCSDCEFRYVCTDCRINITNKIDIYSKPSKCGYNPYTGVWES